MADRENNNDLQELLKTSLEEAKKRARHAKKREEEEEEEGEEEEEEDSKKHRKMEEETSDEDLDEETMAASSLKPAAKSISDAKALSKSKIGMMQHMMGHMNAMSKSDLVDFFNKTMSQFGPNKDYGVSDKSGHNASTLDMHASHAVSSKGPKTKMPMPKLNVKEDVEEMFEGQDLSEDFKDKASTLFEAAINARLIAEAARLEEQYENTIAEELAVFHEEITAKLDTYLDYVVEQWMAANEVAIESTLRNELAEEFMDGLKNLFAEHYINVPQEKVDVLEALADKVNALEEKLDETITENSELKGYVLEASKNEILEEVASDLALTQQEKFAALVEGIEFDGDLDTYAKKILIIKENYFAKQDSSYSSNIEEETFEGDIGTSTTGYVDPNVNRYVQALTKTVKK